MSISSGGLRKYISIVGKRNVGKSSLINCILNQDLSIVSNSAGTTTDPVYKSMQINPIGPVTFIDTAGIDDEGYLGEKRILRTEEVIKKSDIGIIVVDSKISSCEKDIIKKYKKMEIPYLIVVNKEDIINEETRKFYKNFDSEKTVYLSAKNKSGIKNLINKIIFLGEKFNTTNVLPNFLNKNDFILFVMPIDKSAPEGKLIMPQIRAIRESLDNHCICACIQDTEVEYFFNSGKIIPDLVITDSQVIMKIAPKVPLKIKLTTFSILEAAAKGDLDYYIKSIESIDNLNSGDKIVIMESCTHEALEDDIGRKKIPNWLEKYTNKEFNYYIHSGKEFLKKDEIEDTKLIIHCGACNLTKNMMLRRINKAKENDIPFVNYGMIISYLHGFFSRVIAPII